MLLQSEITDHYIEDNSTIQDHIALKPLKVTLKNYIGELTYSTPSIANTSQKVIKKLSNITSYLPTVATVAQETKDIFTKEGLGFTDSVNNAADLWALVKNLNPFASKQQQAYQYFKALYENKILVSIQTPYEFIQSMAIESITAIQPEDSVSITNFNLILKKMRFASSSTIEYDKTKTQNRNSSQAAPIINKGKAPGTAVSVMK
jgi:hypothetical protein